MNRRWFVGASLAAVGSIFVPKYEGWYRQGSGLLVPEAEPAIEDLSTLARDYYHAIYLDALDGQLWLKRPGVVLWQRQ